MKTAVAGALALAASCAALEQYTPDVADWSTFQDKAMGSAQHEDHTPDGIKWIGRDAWKVWDGKVIDPTKHSKKELHAKICPSNTVLGLREVFYKHNPFKDPKRPTKAEVDLWHAIAINHVRALVGYTEPEYVVRPDRCLHARALWSDERAYTRKWDTAEYPGTCVGSTNSHCGAPFVPSKEDQQAYLRWDGANAGIDYCPSVGGGAEGLFSSKASIPWSMKWTRAFCYTLGHEGFWGGHTMPWFHRPLFGFSWKDFDVSNPNSGVGLRAKWRGPKAASKYENPDVTNGRWTVQKEGVSPDPRFPGYECEGIIWLSGAEESATKCYERMMGEAQCGKRFMTYKSGDSGACACYPPSMEKCKVLHRAQRLTWSFEPVETSFGGYLIDSSDMLWDGRVCRNIMWKGGAGDAAQCLQMIVEDDYPAPHNCAKKYITWNKANGGCACYPAATTSCEQRSETTPQSGRQTFAIMPDPAHDPDATLAPKPTPPPAPTPPPTPPPTTPQPGYRLADKMLWSGRVCRNIMWKGGAANPTECLRKILQNDYAAPHNCAKKYVTWNKANGGCACYPAATTSCKKGETSRQWGRQTYEIVSGA